MGVNPSHAISDLFPATVGKQQLEETTIVGPVQKIFMAFVL